MHPAPANASGAGISRALLVGAPRPMLSRRAEAALGTRHRAVLDGLERLLRDGELGRLTIGEIASRLECSRRTLYELAPSKEALTLLVVDRVMHRIGHAALAAVDPAADVAVQLRQYVTAGIGYVFRSAAVDDLADIPGARRVSAAHHRFATTVIERMVASGMDRGEFRALDASVAAAVILAGAVHLAHPEVLDDLGVSLEDALHQLLDVVLTGLLAPPVA